MEYRYVIVERGPIARIRLNRPDHRNAMTPVMADELERALWELDACRETSVIIISGEGKGFCAGADLSGLSADAGFLESREQKRGILRILTAMTKISKVVISQAHGFAVAGGLGIALAADLTVVTNDCKLATPEIRRGFFPMTIMNSLNRLMPRKRCLELMFTGGSIDPQEAFAWGLVNRVTTPETLEEETLRLAESIARSSPSAIGLGKHAFYTMQDMDDANAYEYLSEMLIVATQTQDSKEGMQAFLEKRRPEWSGR